MLQRGDRSRGMVRAQNKRVLAVLWLCSMFSPKRAPFLTVQQGHHRSPEVPVEGQVLLRMQKRLSHRTRATAQQRRSSYLARTVPGARAQPGPDSSPMCSSVTPHPQRLVLPLSHSLLAAAGRLSGPPCLLSLSHSGSVSPQLCLCKELGRAQWRAPHCWHERAQPQDGSSALGEEILSAAAVLTA